MLHRNIYRDKKSGNPNRRSPRVKHLSLRCEASSIAQHEGAEKSGFARGLPRLCVLPTGVGGMVEVEEESLTAVEEAEAEDVVVDEGEGGDDHDVVDEGEGGAAGLALGDDDLGAESAVAVHVLDVAFDGGVGVVDEVGVEGLERRRRR